MMPPGSAATRCRPPQPCTTATCTWTGSRPCRRRAPPAGAGRGGSASTSTTACGSATGPSSAASSPWPAATRDRRLRARALTGRPLWVPSGAAAEDERETVHVAQFRAAAVPAAHGLQLVRHELHPRGRPGAAGRASTGSPASAVQAEQAYRVLLENLRPDGGLDVQQAEVPQPAVRGQQRVVRAEQDLVLQQRVDAAHELRREI